MAMLCAVTAGRCCLRVQPAQSARFCALEIFHCRTATKPTPAPLDVDGRRLQWLYKFTNSAPPPRQRCGDVCSAGLRGLAVGGAMPESIKYGQYTFEQEHCRGCALEPCMPQGPRRSGGRKFLQPRSQRIRSFVLPLWGQPASCFAGGFADAPRRLSSFSRAARSTLQCPSTNSLLWPSLSWARGP
jgi:hypothetical protein